MNIVVKLYRVDGQHSVASGKRFNSRRHGWKMIGALCPGPQSRPFYWDTRRSFESVSSLLISITFADIALACNVFKTSATKNETICGYGICRRFSWDNMSSFTFWEQRSAQLVLLGTRIRPPCSILKFTGYILPRLYHNSFGGVPKRSRS